MLNKKGNIVAILILFVALFLLLFLGVAMAIGSSVINWVFDEAVPELTGLGMVSGNNMTQTVGIALNPVNTMVQNFTWLTAVVYIFGIIGILGLAFAFKTTGNKWLIGFFFSLVFILVISAIFISNIYEDFHNDGGEMGDRLREHKALSFLIIYSPAFMSMIAFIAGIILFSGAGEEGFL